MSNNPAPHASPKTNPFTEYPPSDKDSDDPFYTTEEPVIKEIKIKKTRKKTKSDK